MIAFVQCAVIVASTASASLAQADIQVAPPPNAAGADKPSPDTQPRHRTFGLTMDVGVPDGAALGLAVRPRFDWLRLGAAVTHNGMAPGLRFGVTLDPVSFPMAPTLTVEGGHYWNGTVPGISGSPAIGYNYANFHLGLEFGNRAAFRFFVRCGVSWVDLSGVQAQNANNTAAIANPAYSGWVAPSAKLGFSLYF